MSTLTDARALILEAEHLARIIDIAAAREDMFEAVTIRGARSGFRRLGGARL
jgi:hypothetical protein